MSNLSETQVAASLSAYFKLKGKPMANPKLNGQPVSLVKLFVQVQQQGNHARCNYESCAMTLLNDVSASLELKKLYEEHLLDFEIQFGKRDPMEEFYASDTFKVKSYKPFDSNMIWDKCSPMPLKELNQFLLSRNNGYATLMQDRLSNMLRSSTDPNKLSVLQDIGLVDMLAIIKMLECGIYDEIIQSITLINICSLDLQLDMYFIENPELYSTIFATFKLCLNTLISFPTLFKTGHEQWEEDPLRVIKLVLMFLKTFSNFSQRKDLHTTLLSIDLLDATLNLSNLLIASLQSISKETMFISLHSKHDYTLDFTPISFKHHSDRFALLIECIYHISCIHSQLSNSLMHPSHRLSDLFVIATFTQLHIKDYLKQQNDYNASVLMNYIDETALNTCFVLGNCFIYKENLTIFLPLLSKCADKSSLISVFKSFTTPLTSAGSSTILNVVESNKCFMYLHLIHNLMTKDVLKNSQWDPLLSIQGVMEWMLIDERLQGKGFSLLKNVMGYYKFAKNDNQAFEDSWELLQSWINDLVSDSRVKNRKVAVQLMYLANK